MAVLCSRKISFLLLAGGRYVPHMSRKSEVFCEIYICVEGISHIYMICAKNIKFPAVALLLLKTRERTLDKDTIFLIPRHLIFFINT